MCTRCNSVYDLLAVLRPASGDAIGGHPVCRRTRAVGRKLRGVEAVEVEVAQAEQLLELENEVLEEEGETS